MAGPVTIDASVFINAFNPNEPRHAESSRLMEHVRSQGLPMVVPTLVLPEVAATISRATRDSKTARSFANQLRLLPGLVLVPLDEGLAAQAAEIAAEHRLRGSDAVYGAVSLRFGSTLITFDREQHQRLKPIVRSRYPVEAMQEILGEA
jgi:predicted nucleic acid-binding protein